MTLMQMYGAKLIAQVLSFLNLLTFKRFDDCSLIYQDNEENVVPCPIPLQSEHLSDEGVYFLENGEDGLIYIGESVNSDILQKLFNVRSAAELPSQVN